VKHFGPLRIILVSLLALALGCSKDTDVSQTTGDVKTRLPWAEEGGQYSLQEVLLSGITSLTEFGGNYATFYVYPSVQGDRIHGYHPKTRFLKSGDLYVPEDTFTQEMAVIYAHLQRLAILDNEMGAAGVNIWPRDVGVAVRYNNRGSTETNNAFYDGKTDAMLIVPYTQNNLPIPVNAGILAHEHFHSLYFKLVEKDLFGERLITHGKKIREEVLGHDNVVESEIDKSTTPSTQKDFNAQYHVMFSRGLNEGLADFWAWVYTGDPDFISLSLPSEKANRTLSASGVKDKFMTADDWKFRIMNNYSRSDVGEKCLGLRVAYCLGTDYARTLKDFAAKVQETRGLKSSVETRHEVGKAVLKSLVLLKKSFQNLKEDEYFEPVQFFAMVRDSMADLKAPEKAFMDNLVEKTLKAEKDARQPDTNKIVPVGPVTADKK
jgi:hypothetical protein